MRFVRPLTAPRPADWLIRLVHAGYAVAIIAVGVIAVMHSFDMSRKCHGAFDRGFSNDFDRYRCDLSIRIIENGPELTLTLPI